MIYHLTIALFAEESQKPLQSELFRQIIVLDISRILSRLRSCHARKDYRKAGRRNLIDLLHSTINKSTPGAHRSADQKDVQILVETLALANERFEYSSPITDGMPSVEAQDTLMGIIEQMYRLGDGSKLETVLKSIKKQNPSVDPTTVEFLPVGTRKLGRYYVVSRDLVNAARTKEYTIFSNITIEVLESPKPKLTSLIVTQPSTKKLLQEAIKIEPDLHSSSLSSGKHVQKLTNYQNILKLELQNLSSEEWKVHAEIQLLLFYSKNDQVLAPRIVCSSKSACYLCNLFICLHGRFVVPSTHGWLYKRWTLPDYHSSTASDMRILTAMERMNMLLRDRILMGLGRMKTSKPNPSESVSNLYPPWLSVSTLPRSYLSAVPEKTSLAQHVHVPQIGSQRNSAVAFSQALVSKLLFPAEKGLDQIIKSTAQTEPSVSQVSSQKSSSTARCFTSPKSALSARAQDAIGANRNCSKPISSASPLHTPRSTSIISGSGMFGVQMQLPRDASSSVGSSTLKSSPNVSAERQPPIPSCSTYLHEPKPNTFNAPVSSLPTPPSSACILTPRIVPSPASRPQRPLDLGEPYRSHILTSSEDTLCIRTSKIELFIASSYPFSFPNANGTTHPASQQVDNGACRVKIKELSTSSLVAEIDRHQELTAMTETLKTINVDLMPLGSEVTIDVSSAAMDGEIWVEIGVNGSEEGFSVRYCL